MKNIFVLIPLFVFVISAGAQDPINVQVASVIGVSDDQKVLTRASPKGAGLWRIILPTHILSTMKLGSLIQVKSLVYANQVRAGVVESFDGKAAIVRLKKISRAEMWQPFSFSYLERAQNIMQIPTLAVASTNGVSAYVFLLGKDYILKRSPVEIVSFSAGRLLVRGELKAGDFVVSKGLHRVRDGIRVNAARKPEGEI
jgi:hypothetical protein